MMPIRVKKQIVLPNSCPRAHKGAVLIVSLMLLVVITILGVSGMRNTTLDERMAGNMRDLQLAFYAAESALYEAGQKLKTISLPAFNNTNGYYETDSSLWESIDWDPDNGEVIEVDTTIEGISQKPAYYVEEMPAIPAEGSLEAGTPNSSQVFRITARGVGGSTTSVVILRATVRR